jgi:hypothetical protein
MRTTYITQPSLTASALRLWASCAGPAIEAYEAPNEYDISHPRSDPDWVATIRAYQRFLYRTVKGTASLSRLAVLGPSLTSGDAYRSVGDLSAYLDRGNMHDYFAGHNPGTDGWGLAGYGGIAFNLRLARRIAGAKPVYATETGYGTDGTGQSVDEATQAKYVPRLFLEQFNAGIRRTFEYELVDEGGPPYGSFGLLRKDLTPKPAFNALASLVTLLAKAGTPQDTARAASLTIEGEIDHVHDTVLAGKDGLYVILWVELPGYDLGTHEEIAVAPRHLTLHVAGKFAGAALYRYDHDSLLRPTPIGTNDAIALSVTDEPVVLELKRQAARITPLSWSGS